MGAGCSMASDNSSSNSMIQEPSQLNESDVSSDGTVAYTNKSAGYSLKYPKDLTIYKNVTVGEGKGDTFSFPDEMVDQSIFEPEIKIASTKGACTVTGEKVNMGGKEFIKVVKEDGETGNNHVNESYYITNNNTCYHLDFYSNRANPTNYASSEDQAKQFQVAQDESLKKMRDAFETIVKSLAFSK